MDFWPDFWPIDFWPMRCLFLVFRKLRLETDYALKVRSMLVVWIATQSSHSMAPGHKTAVFLVAPQNSDCRPLEILCWYIRAPSLCGLRLYVIASSGRLMSWVDSAEPDVSAWDLNRFCVDCDAKIETDSIVLAEPIEALFTLLTSTYRTHQAQRDLAPIRQQPINFQDS